VTDKEYQLFKGHLEAALEHLNILVVWVFLSLVGMICVRGEIDTVFDSAMVFVGSASGGMAALNGMWSWRSLMQARAIVRRNRS
jgi:hypothetical protein